jgi:hypothetical protein
MNRFEMKKIIDGKRYNTETATLIADDVYWDGNNFERSGRNSWLYRTPRGAFFLVTGSQWQGESDSLIALSTDEAKIHYEHLHEHHLEWEDAFGEIPGEPEPEPGRPTMYGTPMKQTGIYLPDDMVSWLKNQPAGISETIRHLITQAMQP